MHWLLSLDISLFRFINQTLSNPFFDWLMPFLSGNKQSYPFAIGALVLVAFALIWKNRARGTVCMAMLALIIWPGDTFISNTIKQSVGRLRPFMALDNVRRPGKQNSPSSSSVARESEPKRVKSGSGNSMPSSHAANWGAATMILFIYYRRSWRVMLPLALAVGFSRIYNGVHYPSDVLAGFILGAGYAAGGVWAADALWRWAGQRWFPQQWEKFPSLLAPRVVSKT